MGRAAGNIVRLDVGRARRRGQGGRALTQDATRRDDREIGERVLVAAIVRRGAGGIARIIGEQRTQVLGGGIGLVAGSLGRTLGEIGIDRDVAAPVGKVATGEDVAAVFLAMGALGPAILGVHGQAVEIGLQDAVDHAGHGISPIDGRRTVAQDFQPLQVGGRDGIGVVAQQRHGARGLAGGV